MCYDNSRNNGAGGVKVLIENKVTPSRYKKVMSIMRNLGEPVIECIQVGEGIYYALEGSHRVTSAKELGMKPVLDVVTVIEGDCGDCPELNRIRIDSKARTAKGLFVEFGI